MTTLTPPQLAQEWGCKSEKVIVFIKRGELQAFDVSLHPDTGRPRWRITREAILEFEARRSAVRPVKRRRREKKETTNEFLDIIK